VLNSVGTLTVDNYWLSVAEAGSEETSFDQGYATLTFDDGWVTHYTEARAILNKHAVKGSFYIVTDKLTEKVGSQVALPPDAPGDNHVAEATYGLPEAKGGIAQKVRAALTGCDAEVGQLYVHTDQAQAIAEDGHEVSAHTKTHADLAKLSPEAAREEIIGSRDALKDIGVASLHTFVYPYGAYNPSVMTQVNEAGFTAARSVEEGFNFTSANPYALKVQNVTTRTTLEDVRNWVESAKTKKQWLILVFHQIDRTGTEYSASPEFLEGVVTILKETNTPVITTREGVSKMR
jgi:peptidoglycan/xylan/chitin deacetylase (PgdA/CDA1 family)